MPRKVPFFNYPDLYLRYAERFQKVLDDVGRRGAFIMQRDLEDFEADLAIYSGCKHAVGVANATDGLQMAFLAGGVKPGSEVIISSHTMIATAASVHFAGAKPVPVEAGTDHMINPTAVEAAITPATSTICPTHLNGRTCEMAPLMELAERHGLQLYEDAAQALGSKYRGRAAGTFGLASCISFYPAKVLGCLGDGGAVLTNDDALYERLLLLRDHGRGPDGDVHMWGLNSRLDNLHAAWLGVQFTDYADVISHRRELAAAYCAALGHCSELRLPSAPGADPDHFDVFQNFEIQAERRDELKQHLGTNGVGTLVQWGGTALHQFSRLGMKRRELPDTDRLFERLLMLPLSMSVSLDDVRYVSELILRFYSSGAAS